MISAQSSARSYQQSQVTTIDRGQLLLMMFDGAQRFLAHASRGPGLRAFSRVAQQHAQHEARALQSGALRHPTQVDAQRPRGRECLAVEVNFGEGALLVPQRLNRRGGRRSGRGLQRGLAVELPQADQRADPGVEEPPAAGIQVERAGYARREIGTDPGRVALREQTVHPRQFAVAEGVPVPFGDSK